MANWSDLKAAVASIVKTNGNKEITGQLLQNVLNNIISNVGLNSSFAGIATPETSPGTPDGNVFYLATTAGTYSNFNGIVINSGEAVILEWKGSWVKKDSGFSTKEKLSELSLELDKTNTIVGQSKEMIQPPTISHQRRAYFYGNFKSGDTIIIEVSGTAEFNNATMAARYDDEITNIIILSKGVSKEVVLQRDTSYIVFLINNDNITTEGSIICTIKGLQGRIEKVEEELKELEGQDIDKRIKALENKELSSFKYKGSVSDVLQSDLEVGVYAIGKTDVANLPSGFPTNTNGFLVCYHPNFRIIYAHTKEVWYTYDKTNWLLLVSRKETDQIFRTLNTINEQLFGKVISEENVVGEEIKVDAYIVKDTNRINYYANNNLAIAPFPIQKGETYTISVAKTTNAAGKVLCYAKTLNDLEVTPIIDNVGDRGKFDYTYVAEKDGYLYIGISTDSEYVIVKKVVTEGNIKKDIALLNIKLDAIRDDVELLKCNSIWSGKKWVVIGDSLSTNNRTTTKRYIDYIVEKTGIQVEVLAVGGSSWGKPQLENNAFFQQASRVASDADIVTIFGSFNGWYLRDSEGNITDGPTSLGELDSEDVSTRYGCMNMTLKNIFANAPLARVGVIYPTPWKTVNPFTPTSTGNDLMEMLDNVTKRWGIPKLDLFHGSGMRPWEEEYRLLVYSKDSGGVDGNPSGVHPNEIGHEVIATHVLEFMKTLIM